MSVASTKAFYSQVAAGFLLAFAIAARARRRRRRPAAHRHERLVALRELPDAMHELIGRRAAIGATAQRNALSRRSWAVVGNGVNRVAAQEMRIKLSELCYKSIACDVTEDKKHIDLSAEPMILVCAAGSARLQRRRRRQGGRDLPRAQGGADRDRRRRRGAGSRPRSTRSRFPLVHPDLAFVLCTMAGHLFGYEAALAIDASARPLREARGCIETAFAAVAHRRRSARRARGRARAARRRGSSTSCARATTTAASRPPPRCGSRRCCATRSVSRRSTRTRSSSARSARRARSSKTSPPRSRRPSRS